MTAAVDLPQHDASPAWDRWRFRHAVPDLAPCIAGVSSVFPGHRYAQADITRAFHHVVLGDRADPRTEALLDRLHTGAGVRTRSLALPLSEYETLGGFGEINDTYLDIATELGEQAVREALRSARLEPSDIDTIFTVSVTGMGAPGVDARLIPRLGLRTDVRRVPVFGLGCVAGAAGLARVMDLMRGDPEGVAVLLAVELCSLTVQRNDMSAANLVASGLFGDGAAAVVVVGAARARRMGLAGPAVLSSRSCFYPGTERLMGWDIGDTGFRIVLEPTVADVVEARIGDDVRSFLRTHGLGVDDIGAWVAHPGGPKVISALQASLGVPPAALEHTWQSLSEVGNLSSVSVLDVLSRTEAEGGPAPGTTGLVIGMGVGFCAELVLLQW